LYIIERGEKEKMKSLKSLRNNKIGAGGVVVVLISMMVMLLVGIIVVNSLINSQTPDDTWSEDANTTWSSVQTNIWVAFGLVTVGIIIVGAVAILSYLNFGGSGGSGV
jgi:ABC-type Fe3+ transport system permease subunit